MKSGVHTVRFVEPYIVVLMLGVHATRKRQLELVIAVAVRYTGTRRK